MENLLRVLGINMRDAELRNEHGPLKRKVLEFTAAPLIPGAEPQEASVLQLVLDDAQLHRLRHALLALDLAPTSVMPPPEVH